MHLYITYLDVLLEKWNYYYDIKKCGIGFHGDTERTRVICLSVGGKDYPMTWQWYKNSKTVGEPFNVKLNGGDIYIMSEKEDLLPENVKILRDFLISKP